MTYYNFILFFVFNIILNNGTQPLTLDTLVIFAFIQSYRPSTLLMFYVSYNFYQYRQYLPFTKL